MVAVPATGTFNVARLPMLRMQPAGFTLPGSSTFQLQFLFFAFLLLFLYWLVIDFIVTKYVFGNKFYC